MTEKDLWTEKWMDKHWKRIKELWAESTERERNS